MSERKRKGGDQLEISEILRVIGICFFSYIFGSIPFGYIVAKYVKKVDIQKVGSGNIGGTNIWRALGAKYGFFVYGLDIWKGAVPVIVTMYFLEASWWLTGLAFLFCFLGHSFSVWLRFKGGKGISVFFGGLLGLLGWKVFLIILTIWFVLLIFFVKRRMSVANLIVATGVIFLILLVPVFLYLGLLLIIVVPLIWLLHKENIERIQNGEEPSMKFPSVFNKLPDDLIGLAIEKLQWLIRKLQDYQKQRKP